MNRIVREHYPAAALPENIREGFAPGQIVRVVVEPAARQAEDHGVETSFSLAALFAKARPAFTDIDDVSAHVRTLRDEWDDRR